MHKIKATGPEIVEIIRAIEPALDGRPTDHVYVALLSLALIIQDPDLTSQKLCKGVVEVSNFVAAFMETTDASGMSVATQAN